MTHSWRLELAQPTLGLLKPEGPLTKIREFAAELAYLAIMTPGKLTLNVVRNDPADNRYLECAVEGAADYLVSGDQDLLDLHEHPGIRIVSPKAFLEVLRAHHQRGGPTAQQD